MPRSIELLGWSISSSSGGHSVGSVSVVVAGEAKAGDSTGNGPVNALYKAVDEAITPVLGWYPVLTEYEIRAVSGDDDAQGQVLVRARRSTDEGPGAVVVTGHGLSTNIIEASLEAYLVAANKLHARGDRRRRRGVRGRAHRGGSPVTEAAGEGSPPVYRVALIPGDGVGPEVIAGAVSVLEAVGRRFGFGFAWDELVVGGAGIDAYGVAIRPEDVEACRDADAVLLGAVGGPKWDDPDASVRPEQALFALRGGLGLFANLRPITVAPQLIAASPLKPELLEGVDCLILRELTSGLYFGRPSEQRDDPRGPGRHRHPVVHGGARSGGSSRWPSSWPGPAGARSRPVDKANVLATSRLWRKVAEEVHADFPDVELEHRLVDSAAMVLAKWPAGFDVLVTENLFGDILSDEAAVIAGSLGLLPSASLGTRTTAHGRHGLYEPIHGSAPDIAGQDLANPLGTILSAAMMLRWSLGQPEAAAAIETAVNDALDAGYRTRDLLPGEGGDEVAVTLVGTREMARVIGERIAI